MAETIYTLCALTSFLCAWLLLRSYNRTRYKLLFWSGLCFIGLFVNNVFLILDKVFFPSIDLSLIRLLSALIAPLLLVFGLIWQKEN
ncbi:MAG: DUF5985 family protein [Sulfurifustis sp.]